MSFDAGDMDAIGASQDAFEQHSCEDYPNNGAGVN